LFIEKGNSIELCGKISLGGKKVNRIRNSSYPVCGGRRINLESEDLWTGAHLRRTLLFGKGK